MLQRILVLGVVMSACGDERVPQQSPPPMVMTNPDAGTPPMHKRVFVTRTTYSGDLSRAAGMTSGIEAADKLCQLAADAALVGGMWRAWISSSTVDAVDRIDDVGPWYAMDGTTRLFNNKANLSTSPLTNVSLDELGQDIGFGSPIWTGTDTGGRRHSEIAVNNCVDWTLVRNERGFIFGAMTGATGTATELASWTQFAYAECDDPAQLLCIEQ